MSRIIYIDYELQIGGKYLLEYVQPFNICSTNVYVYKNSIIW